AGCLATYVTVAVLAGAALCSATPQHTAASTCCPGVGPGQVCPMHRTPEGRETCGMCRTGTGADAAMLSMFGMGGILGRPSVARADFRPVFDISPVAQLNPLPGFQLDTSHPPRTR